MATGVSTQPLLKQIQDALDPCGGRWSVAAVSLTDGREINIRADEVYPAASVIKTFLLGALLAARDEGRLTLTDKLRLVSEEVVGGSGILCEMEAGHELTLLELAKLMIVLSDNTATNMIIGAVGTPYIAGFLEANGFQQTKLQRKLFDMEARAAGLDNLITARESALMFQKLKEQSISPLTPQSCELALDILRRQQHKNKLPHLLPKEAVVANKPGWLDDASHDAALVESPDGRVFSLAILTAGWKDSAQAQDAIARASRAVYDDFAG